MTEMKHYFLSLNAKEVKYYSEKLNLLKGYVATRVSMKMDPEHGPVDPEGEILDTCYPMLKNLTDGLSDFHKDTVQEVVNEARKQMAKDIINCITNNAAGIDLLVKLQQTLENYEIIGRREFRPDETTEEWPF